MIMRKGETHVSLPFLGSVTPYKRDPCRCSLTASTSLSLPKRLETQAFREFFAHFTLST